MATGSHGGPGRKRRKRAGEEGGKKERETRRRRTKETGETNRARLKIHRHCVSKVAGAVIGSKRRGNGCRSPRRWEGSRRRGGVVVVLRALKVACHR